MKCKVVYEYNGQHEVPLAVVIVKLHRHMIEITGLEEIDAVELEEILGKTTKIKVRRYEDGSNKKVQGNKSDNRARKNL